MKAQFAEYDVDGSTPAETDTNGNRTRAANAHDLHIHPTLTNSPTGLTVYSGQSVQGVAETPVANLAQNIYESRAMLDYDGSHEIIDSGIKNAPHGSGATQPLQQIIGHWNVLNFTGGAAAWRTANMTIAGTEIDLVTNHIRIDVGPSKHLSPQDWSSMLEFFRRRLPLMPSSVRATGAGAGGGNVDMALNSSDENTVPGQTVDSQHQLLTYATLTDPTSSVKGASNLDTGLVASITAGKTPVGTAPGMVTLQPRAMAVCDNAGNNFFAVIHATQGHTTA